MKKYIWSKGQKPKVNDYESEYESIEDILRDAINCGYLGKKNIYF